MWWVVTLVIFLALTMGQAFGIAFSSARRPGWRDGGPVPPVPKVPNADDGWAARLLIEAKEQDRILFAQNPLAFWNDPHRYDGLRLEEWEEAQGECDPFDNQLGFGGFPSVPGDSQSPPPVTYGRPTMRAPVMWQGVARVPGTVEVKQLDELRSMSEAELIQMARVNVEIMRRNR